MTTASEQIALPKKEQIERRAYQIYLERGAQDGQDVSDWVQAEQELTMTAIPPSAVAEPLRPNRKAASNVA